MSIILYICIYTCKYIIACVYIYTYVCAYEDITCIFAPHKQIALAKINCFILKLMKQTKERERRAKKENISS